MVKKLLLTITLPILTIICLTVVSSFAAKAETKQSDEFYDNCDIDTDLHGTLNQNHGTVVNSSNNPICEHKATLALYDAPLEEGSPRWIEVQTLINYKTVTVKPGQTVEIVVDGVGPSCRIQSDLIRGDKLVQPPYYTNAMDAKVYTVKCEIVTPDKTPTPAPISTPTNTPAPGQSKAPTSTPGPAATSTPVPGQPTTSTSSTSDSSKNILALTGNSAFIYAVILAGSTSLISGLILKKLSK
jgi:hypothetical protein